MLGASLVAALALMTAVYCIPEGSMEAAAHRSAETLASEGYYPKVISSLDGNVDTWTDSIMINIASHQGDEGPLRGAMRNTRAIEGPAEGEATLDLLAAAEGRAEYAVDYSRYWHGYLVVLKPLLALGLDISAIRLLSCCLCIAALSVLFALIAYRRRRALVVPVLALLVGIWLPAVPLSMQYCSVFYITVGALIAMFAAPSLWASRKRASYAFLAIGILTSFFDLLTFPLLTFGVPCATWLLLFSAGGSAKARCARVARLFAYWIVGYGGFWAAKWLVASAVLRDNLVAEALSQSLLRTSGSDLSGEAVSTCDVLSAIARHFTAEPLVLIPLVVLLAAMLLVVAVGASRRGLGSGALASPAARALLPYALIALLPLLWFALLKNHSYVHQWMTFRTAAVSVYALFMWLAQLADDMRVRRAGAGSPDEAQGPQTSS